MALLFMDGFDRTTTAEEYDAPMSYYSIGPTDTANTPYGRGGSMRSVYGVGGPRLALASNVATIITGFHVQLLSDDNNDRILFTLWDAGTAQCEVRFDGSTTKGLSVRRMTGGDPSAGVTVASDTRKINLGWVHIEAKVTVHGSAGAVEVRVNGQTLLTATGLDLTQTANNYANQISLGFGNWYGGGPHGPYYDDWYVLDTTGTRLNDFIGERRIITTFPVGTGNASAWTPSAGSNFATVDDVPPNEDTDYVSTATVGATDSHLLGDLPANTLGVEAIKHTVRARKDDAGSRTLRSLLRTNSTNYESADMNLSDSYTDRRVYLELNPDTGLPWTPAEVNALEAGYKLQA